MLVAEFEGVKTFLLQGYVILIKLAGLFMMVFYPR
jgi:hypothetical protein